MYFCILGSCNECRFLNKIMNTSIGQPAPQIIMIGSPTQAHHMRCSFEKHSMSKSTLTWNLLSSTFTHWKISSPTFVSIGCRRNKITIIVTTIFLIMSGNLRLHSKNRIPHTTTASRIKARGSSPVKKILNTAVDGANILTS